MSKQTVPGYNGKEVDVGWWSEQIRAGIEFRDKWTCKAKWDDWDKFYRNEYELSTMPVNLFHIMARSFVPRVYFRNPSLSVSAAKPGPEFLGLAILLERIDNKLMRTMRMKEAMRKITNQIFFRGTGVGKLGFGAQFQPVEYAAHQAKPASAVQGKMTMEYRAGIDPDMPWFLPVSTEHYILPAGVVDRLDTPWAVHAIFRNVDEVRLDPRLSNTKDIGPTHDGIGKPGIPDLIEQWEVHDYRTGLAFIMAADNERHKGAVLYGPGYDGAQSGNGGPMFPAVFNPNMDVFWGLPDGQLLEPLQQEINEITNQIRGHRRLTLIKFLAQEDAVTKEQARAYLNDEDLGAMIFMKEMGTIKEIQVATIPPELFMAFDRVMEIVRLTFGFSRNQFGEFQPGSEKPTASEARAVKEAAEIRVDERRDVMADYMVDVMEDTNRLISEHWSTERVEQVAGPFGIPIWVKFTGEMLKSGRFDLTVEPDSGLPETKQLREEKAIKTYSLLYPLSQAPDMQLGYPIINSMKLNRFFLHSLHGVAYDDMLMGVPNIYDERLVRALGEGSQGMTTPVEPGQLGAMMQKGGPAASAMQPQPGAPPA